jgi:hypothetical protein
LEFLAVVSEQFNWSVDTWWKVWNNFQLVFYLLILGFVSHWLPQKWKDQTVLFFSKWPMPIQALTFAVAVFVMYQAVSDTFKAFVYFQF